MLEWRLDAYRQWLKMEAPSWAHLDYPPIDYKSIFLLKCAPSARKIVLRA